MKLVLVVLFSLSAFAQLPNSKRTPGAIRTTSSAEICAPSFRTKPFRKTTKQMKQQVCAWYGVKKCPQQGTLEIDHLVPLELGGKDSTANLWPEFSQYADHSPGFHIKDKLENELKRKVCAREMKLTDAQTCIRGNWISCYRRVFRKNFRKKP